MRIRYYCHWSELSGFGRAARDYVAALARAGAQVDVVSWSGNRASPEPRYQHPDVFSLEDYDRLAPPDVAVFHASTPWLIRGLPPRLIDDLDRVPRVAMTTWETLVAPDWVTVGLADSFDRVIVPSTYARTGLQAGAANVELDVRVVPHIFDPAFWAPSERTSSNDAEVRFYTSGVWSERKNPLGVVRAYLHAFTLGEDVKLTLAVADPDVASLRALLACSGIPANQQPRIELLPGAGMTMGMGEQQLLDLHRDHDCYVTATRGEAWGLGMFEAACMRRLVIAPSHGGQTDFLDGNVHALYPTGSTPCFGHERRGAVQVQADGRAVQQSTIAIPPGVDARQCWGEPNLDELARAMRAFYGRCRFNGKHSLRLTPETDRDRLIKHFSYATVGPQLLETLR